MSARGKSVGKAAESGYALLVVVAMAALMAIAVAAVVPDLITQNRREREEEMIWRGNQYVRAIRLYYRKNGRFPQSLEDLTEKKQQIRYLRQAYTDPMNKEDGSWRLIYVLQNGVLVGSVTRTGLIQIGGGPQRPGGAGFQQPGKGQQPGFGTGQQPTTIGTPLQGPVFGGNIIGVASKVERPSLKTYNERSIYREWEFIWDPTRDAVVVGQPGTQPGKAPFSPGIMPPTTITPPQRPPQ